LDRTVELPPAVVALGFRLKDAIGGLPAILWQSGTPQCFRLGTDERVAAEPLQLRPASAVEQLVIGPVSRCEKGKSRHLISFHGLHRDGAVPEVGGRDSGGAPPTRIGVLHNRHGTTLPRSCSSTSMYLRHRGLGHCTAKTAGTPAALDTIGSPEL